MSNTSSIPGTLQLPGLTSKGSLGTDSSGNVIAGSGGSQTPWTSDIDGGNYHLYDTSDIILANPGSQKVTNGTFNSGSSGWTLFGSCTYDSTNHALLLSDHAGGTGADQNITIASGWYIYSFQITNYSGNLQFKFRIGSSFATSYYTGNGIYTVTAPVYVSSGTFIELRADVGTGSFNADNISLIPYVPNHDLWASHLYGDASGVTGNATSLSIGGNAATATTASNGANPFGLTNAALDGNGSNGELEFSVYDLAHAAGTQQTFQMGADFTVYSGPLKAYFNMGDIDNHWGAGGNTGQISYQTDINTMALSSNVGGLLLNVSGLNLVTGSNLGTALAIDANGDLCYLGQAA